LGLFSRLWYSLLLWIIFSCMILTHFHTWGYNLLERILSISLAMWILSWNTSPDLSDSLLCMLLSSNRRWVSYFGFSWKQLQLFQWKSLSNKTWIISLLLRLGYLFCTIVHQIKRPICLFWRQSERYWILQSNSVLLFKRCKLKGNSSLIKKIWSPLPEPS